MHRRRTRALLAAAAASAAVTALGVTATGAAAAPARPAGQAKAVTSPIYTTDRAGYRAGLNSGWRFRWITSTFLVPNCADESAKHGWTANGVVIGANGTQWRAYLFVGCSNDGAGAPVTYQLIRNGTTEPEVTLPITPTAGHSVTASIYYDRAAGVLHFTATDVTTGDSLARAVGVGTGIDYLGAGAGSYFRGTITAPPTDVRTGAFSDTHLTSYNVTRATLLGPWPTSQIIATVGGTASGDVIANAPVLYNGGQNFGVWERTTAH